MANSRPSLVRYDGDSNDENQHDQSHGKADGEWDAHCGMYLRLKNRPVLFMNPGLTLDDFLETDTSEGHKQTGLAGLYQTMFEPEHVEALSLCVSTGGGNE